MALCVGQRVLLLALSEEPDKPPLGYLSSRLLADASDRSSYLPSRCNLDCALSPARTGGDDDVLEPLVVSDCVFRVEACLDRHESARANLAHRQLEADATNNLGRHPVQDPRHQHNHAQKCLACDAERSHCAGTRVRYSKMVQLVHEGSDAMVCLDVRERSDGEGFAMRVVLKTFDLPAVGEKHVEEWFDTWWELRPPDNIRISQVLHYDEVCLHSNRWQRSIRAIPTTSPPACSRGGGGAVSRSVSFQHPSSSAVVVSRADCVGEVNASFNFSLLRIIPYDDTVPAAPSVSSPSSALTASVNTPHPSTNTLSGIGGGGGGQSHGGGPSFAPPPPPTVTAATADAAAPTFSGGGG